MTTKRRTNGRTTLGLSLQVCLAAKHGATYLVKTAAASGTIFTLHFGDKFDAERVDTKLFYEISVYPPKNVKGNGNVTLHFEFEKFSIESIGKDTLSVSTDSLPIIVDRNHAIYNFTPPMKYAFVLNRQISLYRDVNSADVRKQKLKLMPGFKFTWYYSGREVASQAKYYDSDFYQTTKCFIRNGSKTF